jgi:hypothetical protein
LSFIFERDFGVLQEVPNLNNEVFICTEPRGKNPWYQVDMQADKLRLHGEWQVRVISPVLDEKAEDSGVSGITNKLRKCG